MPERVKGVDHTQDLGLALKLETSQCMIIFIFSVIHIITIIIPNRLGR